MEEKSIYLCTREDGTPVSVPVSQLCHVTLEGSEQGGRTNLLQMAMAQQAEMARSSEPERAKVLTESDVSHSVE